MSLRFSDDLRTPKGKMVGPNTRSLIVFVALILQHYVMEEAQVDTWRLSCASAIIIPASSTLTQGDLEGKAMIVSWVTMDEPGSSQVLYWIDGSDQKLSANGKVNKYKFYNYTSGFIHHCTIRRLKPNTKYHYEVGIGHTVRSFWFMSPPEVGPDAPYTFGLIGDLGQSYDSNKTLTHYEQNPTKGQAVLFVGDLSYADQYPNHDNARWDSWGRFVERSVAYQPWIWTVGNHEIDFVPEIGETKPFKPYDVVITSL
ncbi:hypothetical protein Leryth_007737 [Lithospermum erythrorhizon]|nr:hypothetical protein Leryth_007737 [Lithospermum erythrorhizon]